jgi:hypothetical protein
MLTISCIPYKNYTPSVPIGPAQNIVESSLFGITKIEQLIAHALKPFQHPIPTRPQHAPHIWHKSNHGAKIQYATLDNTTCFLDIKDTKRIQEVFGTFSYIMHVLPILLC